MGSWAFAWKGDVFLAFSRFKPQHDTLAPIMFLIPCDRNLDGKLHLGFARRVGPMHARYVEAVEASLLRSGC